MLKIAIACTILALAGCAGTPSPEREARAFTVPAGCTIVTTYSTATRIKTPENGIKTVYCPRNGRIGGDRAMPVSASRAARR